MRDAQRGDSERAGTYHEQQKLKYWGAPVPVHLRHAPASRAAAVYGCDCKLCLPSGRRRRPHGQAIPQRERERKLRAAKYGQPVPPGTKHGIYAAKVYGCGCGICTSTRRQARRNQRHAWRARATGIWVTGRDGTGAPLEIIHWPPVGRGIWTCPDCGQQFRRRPPKEGTIAA